LQLVYAVLGLYATIGIYFSAKSGTKAREATLLAPRPDKPDYHTGVCQAAHDPPRVSGAAQRPLRTWPA
jgi:hypothetical protein